jgi:hypothetical protein
MYGRAQNPAATNWLLNQMVDLCMYGSAQNPATDWLLNQMVDL